MNIRSRVLAALKLGDLTIRQLAAMLWSSEDYVRHVLDALRQEKRVTVAGFRRDSKKGGQAWWLWRLT